MKYSIFTRSRNRDYQWNPPPADSLVEYVDGCGVAVKRGDNDLFSVCIKSEPDAGTVDFVGRPIVLALQIDSCTETKAKGLVVWALEHFGHSVAELSRCVVGFGRDTWEINVSAVEDLVNKVTDIPLANVRWGERYENAETEGNRQRLIKQIRHCDWTKDIGLKLVVDSGILTGENLNIIRSEVNQYLFRGAAERKLESPKKSFFEDYFADIVKFMTTNTVARNLIVIVFVGMVLLVWQRNSQITMLRKENVVLTEKQQTNNSKLAGVNEKHQQELENLSAEWEKKLESAHQIIEEKEKEIAQLKYPQVVSVPPDSDVSAIRAELKDQEAHLSAQRKEIVRYIDEMIKELTKTKQAVSGEKNAE